MLDHITLHVRDIERSIAFYRQALAPLGYVAKAHHEPTIGFGVDDGTLHSDFYVSPMNNDSPLDDAEASPVTHVAFLAPDRESVQAFYQAALAAGGRDNGAPGPRPYPSRLLFGVRAGPGRQQHRGRGRLVRLVRGPSGTLNTHPKA